jgi:hypothetical protein
MIIDQKQRLVERAVLIYLAVFLLLTALAWLPFLVGGFSKSSFPLSEPYERFGDLAHFAGVHQKLAHPHLEDDYHLAGTMFPKNYGPVAVLIYLFLLKVCSPYSIVVFLAIVVFSLTLSSFLLWRAARCSPGYHPYMALAIFATGLLALPTAETELRGNIEGFLWIGYAAGISYIVSHKWIRSAAILAVASCIKPYPAFWFALFIFHRKYKQAVFGGLIILVTIVGALAVLGKGNPKLGTARITGGGAAFFNGWIVGFRDVHEASGDHSLFQLSKSACRVIESRGFHLRPQYSESRASAREGYILLSIYLPLASLSLISILWIIRQKPFLNQIFSMSICLTLFPLIAGDYTLTILYLPMGIFLLFLLRDVATGRATIPKARLLLIVISCGWVMAPQPLLGIWVGDVRAIVLLFLLLIVISTPMPMATDRQDWQEDGISRPTSRSLF